ncbi:UDP-N-acetylmuramate--L-alanine ligase [Garciella nitratireducens]|uniref:UDP-N-acetylmuramate--L-alanine ligase n=1 Tax=Garciella nitratireducens DSM 15102 TaxID=1121911 RepID=A0A1T4L479_9FIRM|nr:UDP-N-acetylmuramate--L-alanine ligase [Garciella nitratireducens]RBP40620.1 UDP-N-acetylmuramate--L-alanine ligase [Garciella nitratireducens]SJZ49357.1 UDP-N-acetylmuramate--L-alanine ligase [Garciella nitratireducens DSM 15102]
MSKFDLSQYKHVHFIGIGGISMSGLAEILLYNHYIVSGSDMKSSTLTKKLESKGATIYIGHNRKNIKNVDLVIYTAAVKADNEELIRAHELNIPTMERAVFLGEIMKNYDKCIAVSGTHGKTTTTSMISIILEHAKYDPTILVGGELDAIEGNVKVGNSEYFITEACEYVESFLHFYPYIGIILNIEEDHLDYFENLDHIKQAFRKFCNLIPKNGCLIANGDNDNVVSILKDVECPIVTFGTKQNCDWQAVNINFDNMGCASFDVIFKNKNLGKFYLAIPGMHNVINALSAIACSYYLEVPLTQIKQGLMLFKSPHRRFELKGKIKNISVIDDYAHHPTEIKATLEAAKKYPHKKLWCIFQPHTYTRTLTLLNEFSQAFPIADEVIIADIYAAREKDLGLIHAKDLANTIKATGQNAKYLGDFSNILSYLLENLKPGDLVITMGAGNINQVGDLLLTELAK